MSGNFICNKVTRPLLLVVVEGGEFYMQTQVAISRAVPRILRVFKIHKKGCP